MGEMATLIEGTPGSRPVADVSTVPLLRRVVESLATMRPGRYTVYLGRPDVDHPEEAWLVTNPMAVRRFIAAVEGELARPDPQLLAV